MTLTEQFDLDTEEKKLITFTFCEKNSNGVIFFDAYSENEAWTILKEKVKYPEDWRYEEHEDTYQD